MFECIEASLAATKIWQEQILTAAEAATPSNSDQPHSGQSYSGQSYAGPANSFPSHTFVASAAQPLPVSVPANPIAALAALQVAAITKPLQAWEWAFDAVGGKQQAAAAQTSFQAPGPKQDASWMPSMALMFPWLAMKPEVKAPPTPSPFDLYQPLMQSMFAPWMALASPNLAYGTATPSAFTPSFGNPMFGGARFTSPSFAGQAFGFPTFNSMSNNPFGAAFQFPSKAFDASHWTTTMADMAKIYWSMPAMPWTLYQAPMTAMFVSAGMPYAIAAPAARASAAALDAADAARLQAIQTFDAYSSYRSDGGHASAQVITWPFADPSAKYRAT